MIVKLIGAVFFVWNKEITTIHNRLWRRNFQGYSLPIREGLAACLEQKDNYYPQIRLWRRP